MRPHSMPALAEPRPPGGKRLLPIIVATSLANGLEVYNITVFGLFASIIGEQFFPASDPLTSLLFAVAAFAFGFLMRPVGALLIGAFADRVGRRAAISLTVWLTAIGTGTIAFCPGYDAIGIAAPIILIIGRLLEGIAAGGELGAAATYALENVPKNRRGWICGWQLGSQATAALVGAGLGVFLSSAYSPISPAPLGWRVPFMVGLLIVPMVFIMRRLLPEHSMKAMARETGNSPLKMLFTCHVKTVVLAALLMGGRSSLFYVMVYYMPSYLSKVVHLPPMTGFIASSVAAGLLLVLSPMMGWLADRVRSFKMLNVFATGTVTLLVFPVFSLATHHGSFGALLGAIGVVCTILALGAPAGNLVMLSVFPQHVRASGFAFTYGIGASLFGGTAQFIVTALVKHTGDPLAPAWYLTGTCLLSFVAACCLRPLDQARRCGG